ncbi:MAG: acyl-CoA dehydrogenase family protein [Gammaproteobacteria bacterium]
MDFAWTDKHKAYRREITAVLEQALPPDWWETYAWDGPSSKPLMQFARGFARRLAEKDLVVRHWPRAYGGQDTEPWEHIILSEEMWSTGEPRSSLYLGSNWAGPAIMQFGTEAQKRKYLPAIASGEMFFCQGFSEPSAGSDLAAMRTSAERTNDGYVINGSKVWTSYAHSADMCFLLARVGGDRRSGVSCFLMPMDTPGIRLRTIRGMEEDDTHELFLTDVHLPDDARLGEEGRGWEIVTAALHYERVGAARYEFARRALDHAVAVLRQRGQFEDPIVQAKAASALALCEAARLITYEVIDRRVKNQPPTAVTSAARYAMGMSDQAVANFIATYLPDSLTETGDAMLMAHYKVGTVSTIVAGAAEVQLNLIARGQLQLPKGG